HERVIRGQVRAAGIAEYDVDTFGLEAFHDGVDGAHHREQLLTVRDSETKGSLTTLQSRRFGLDRHFGEVEVCPAAHAHRVVQLDDLPARRALAPQLVAVGAVEDRGQQAE